MEGDNSGRAGFRLGVGGNNPLDCMASELLHKERRVVVVVVGGVGVVLMPLLQDALTLFMALRTVLTEVGRSCLPPSKVPPHDAVTVRWGVRLVCVCVVGGAQAVLCYPKGFSNSAARTVTF